MVLAFVSICCGIVSFIIWLADENLPQMKWVWVTSILYLVIFIQAICVAESESPTEINENLSIVQVKNAKDFNQFTPTIVGKLGNYTFGSDSKRKIHYFADTKFTESYYAAGWRGFLWFNERCEYTPQSK
jgi:hypothetical protein